MAVSPTGVSKSVISYRVLLFSLARQELSSMRSGTALLKINFRNIIVELHSNGVVVRCLPLFHQARGDEIMKYYYFLVHWPGHRRGTHDQMMYLIFISLDKISDEVQF